MLKQKHYRDLNLELILNKIHRKYIKISGAKKRNKILIFILFFRITRMQQQWDFDDNTRNRDRILIRTLVNLRVLGGKKPMLNGRW